MIPNPERPVSVIVGLNRGDEGKGRYTDMWAEYYDMIARYGGGANAGHQLVFGDQQIALHQIPSGIAWPNKMNIIGAATYLNPISLVDEIEEVRGLGISVSEVNLLVSSAAHLVLPSHVSADEISESGKNADGSTKSGIRYAASDKYGRWGIRAESINNHYDKLMKRVVSELVEQRSARRDVELPALNEAEIAEKFSAAVKSIGQLITDTGIYVGERLDDGATLLAEGAQGFLLDIDQGMFPYTTSANTTAGGATSLGFGPTKVGQTLGVFKAVPSHVGGGPFITKIHDEEVLDRLDPDPQAVDGESGKTTGRRRDLGILDLAQIKRAVMANSPTALGLTKLDWVPRYGDTVPIVPNHRRKGKDYKVAADAAYKLEESSPAEPIHMPNWTEDEVTSVRNYQELPQEAQDYIEYLEEELRVPITMIGVGPDREQVIVR